MSFEDTQLQGPIGIQSRRYTTLEVQGGSTHARRQGPQKLLSKMSGSMHTPRGEKQDMDPTSVASDNGERKTGENLTVQFRPETGVRRQQAWPFVTRRLLKKAHTPCPGTRESVSNDTEK